MKSITYTTIFLLAIAFYHSSAQVAINSFGNEADSSAMLDVQSSKKGFLAPRMTNFQIDSIQNPAEGLIVYNTDAHKPVYFSGTDWMFFDGGEMLYIGKYYQDGVIFYLDSSGQHGLICALSDSTNLPGVPAFLIYTTWTGGGLDLVGASGTAIGTGLANTIAIVLEYQPFDCAAMWCYNGEDPDHPWFLPSIDELSAMYQNKALINATSIANGGTSLFEDRYWSSSEFSEAQAHLFNFGTGNPGYSFKSNFEYARSIRAF
jgi:hypothetical protein